jgi:hypothetical protein
MHNTPAYASVCNKGVGRRVSNSSFWHNWLILIALGINIIPLKENAVFYAGYGENNFPHSITGDRVKLVGCHSVLCPQAAFLVCDGTYDLHRAGGAGTVLC